MQKEFHSIRRHIYVLGLLVIVLWVISYGASFAANIWLDQQVEKRQSQLSAVQTKVMQIGSERDFFSYDFAKKITKEKSIKRSDHIKALITVLSQIQNNDYVGANVIQLSDFSITPESISVKWKVSNLLLLYYSSKIKNYTSVIERFAELPFISGLSIKKYTKIGEYFEFVLTADINLNATNKPTIKN